MERRCGPLGGDVGAAAPSRTMSTKMPAAAANARLWSAMPLACGRPVSDTMGHDVLATRICRGPPRRRRPDRPYRSTAEAVAAVAWLPTGMDDRSLRTSAGGLSDSGTRSSNTDGLLRSNVHCAFLGGHAELGFASRVLSRRAGDGNLRSPGATVTAGSSTTRRECSPLSADRRADYLAEPRAAPRRPLGRHVPARPPRAIDGCEPREGLPRRNMMRQKLASEIRSRGSR